MVRLVEPFPFATVHAAKDILQRVEGEAEQQNADGRPVDDTCDVCAVGVDQDVRRLEVAVVNDGTIG